MANLGLPGNARWRRQLQPPLRAESVGKSGGRRLSLPHALAVEKIGQEAAILLGEHGDAKGGKPGLQLALQPAYGPVVVVASGGDLPLQEGGALFEVASAVSAVSRGMRPASVRPSCVVTRKLS